MTRTGQEGSAWPVYSFSFEVSSILPDRFVCRRIQVSADSGMPLVMKIVAAAAFRIAPEDLPVMLRNLNEAILIAQANSVARL